MKLGAFEIPTEEIGDTWQLSGVLYDNGKEVIGMVLPFIGHTIDGLHLHNVYPSDEEWTAFLKQTDDPVTPVGKAFVRKATRQIDQSIVWRCYFRDNYTCRYCGKRGVMLTYDHYLAQKFGGQTTMDNGRTSCRPCNKRKGHMTIDQWKAYALKNGLQTGE
jgi:hypothetical protein